MAIAISPYAYPAYDYEVEVKEYPDDLFPDQVDQKRLPVFNNIYDQHCGFITDILGA